MSDGASPSDVRPRIESLHWQISGVFVATAIVAALHWPNDGLWFQGDAPRHAANGLFLWDYLTSLPADPLAYAVSYYARYPVIAPLVYPPLFYVIEGVAFWLTAPSPYVAKSIVLAFAAMTGLYTMAWARRWADPAAGWAGACTLLLPGFVRYSNAVLLNVPATALTIAGLYHLVVWLETGRSRHQKWFVALTAAALLTYYPAAIGLPVAMGWMLLSGRWRRSRTVWLFPIALVLVVVVMAVALPQYWERNAPAMGRLLNSSLWLFYGRQLLALVSPAWIALGFLGLLLACTGPRRRECLWLTMAMATIIVCLILLPAESDRYALLLVPMFVLSAFLGLTTSWTRFEVVEASKDQLLRWVTVLLLMGVAGLSALQTRVPVVSGFERAAAYLREHGTTDTVLFSGHHDGVFSFYVRAGDPGFQRRVVLAHKLLARYEQDRIFVWHETAYVNSASEVVPWLQRRCGCRWVAVEVTSSADVTTSERYLREALSGPAFERVESFPLVSRTTDRLDLYRFLAPFDPAPTVDLVFPSFSERVFQGVEPIRR